MVQATRKCCENCHVTLADKSIICIGCGFNQETHRFIKTEIDPQVDYRPTAIAIKTLKGAGIGLFLDGLIFAFLGFLHLLTEGEIWLPDIIESAFFWKIQGAILVLCSALCTIYHDQIMDIPAKFMDVVRQLGD